MIEGRDLLRLAGMGSAALLAPHRVAERVMAAQAADGIATPGNPGAAEQPFGEMMSQMFAPLKAQYGALAMRG